MLLLLYHLCFTVEETKTQSGPDPQREAGPALEKKARQNPCPGGTSQGLAFPSGSCRRFRGPLREPGRRPHVASRWDSGDRKGQPNTARWPAVATETQVVLPEANWTLRVKLALQPGLHTPEARHLGQGLGLLLAPWEERRSPRRRGRGEADVGPGGLGFPWGDDGWEVPPQSEGPGGGGPAPGLVSRHHLVAGSGTAPPSIHRGSPIALSTIFLHTRNHPAFKVNLASACRDTGFFGFT